MNVLKIIRVLFLLLITSLFQNTSCVYSLSHLDRLEQLSAVFAVPAVLAERYYENKHALQGTDPGKMAKFSKIAADIARLTHGALMLKNQYDKSQRLNLRLQKYTLLWLLIDAIKLGADVLPESTFEQLVGGLLSKLDDAGLTEYEKAFHEFFNKNKITKNLRTSLLPTAEVVAMLSCAFTEQAKTRFYISGVKGLCRSFDEYLGAKHTTVKRLFLLLFIAHLVMLGYDGKNSPDFYVPVAPVPVEPEAIAPVVPESPVTPVRQSQFEDPAIFMAPIADRRRALFRAPEPSLNIEDLDDAETNRILLEVFRRLEEEVWVDPQPVTRIPMSQSVNFARFEREGIFNNLVVPTLVNVQVPEGAECPLCMDNYGEEHHPVQIHPVRHVGSDPHVACLECLRENFCQDTVNPNSDARLANNQNCPFCREPLI